MGKVAESEQLTKQQTQEHLYLLLVHSHLRALRLRGHVAAQPGSAGSQQALQLAPLRRHLRAHLELGN